jgi:glycosyltransferase involved in cell wall biosynthesis
MAFGLVCIGSDFGLIRTFLADGRGLTVTPGDVRELADAIKRVVWAPEEYSGMRLRASEWAQRYSVEGLRDALQRLMAESWKIAEMLPQQDLPEIR